MGRVKAGQKYGELTVSHLNTTLAGKKVNYWVCNCSCGAQVCVRERELLMGRVKSCGCLKRKTKMEFKKKLEEEKKPLSEYKLHLPPIDLTKLRPYKPKNIEQFGMDEWMFQK